MFAKRKTGRAFLGKKRVIKGGGSLVNKGKAGVFGQKPFSFLSPRRTEEREGRSAAASIPVLWGMVAAGDEGKRERGN